MMNENLIGKKVYDLNNKVESYITNFIYGNSSSSIEVFIAKLSDKGIDHTQWFTEKEFEKRFNLL